ncbi:MAG TPA: acyl-[ACP]--phospholipid O-acyltransferase [Kiritimatiellia bacterium]|nr:acyl-[ACP]--phospholipid O-acyltransferase [Kiritimatiellia bacterium]
MPDTIQPLNRSFLWLNATQFLGAMNDNIFKLLVTFFLIRGLGAEFADRIAAAGVILFALPFVLFTPAAGVLADRHSKQVITVWTRWAEVGVMIAAAVMFWSEIYYAAFLILFLMSAQSAFFGPSKYGLIPELVQSHELSKANSFLILFTYLAIILGTVAGPTLTDVLVGPASVDGSNRMFAVAALVCVGLACGGLLASRRIGRTPAAGSEARISWWVIRDVVKTYRSIGSDRYLVLATLASAYFSLIGAFMQINLIPYALVHLEVAETAGGYLFFFAAIGIGAGSWIAGKLSGRNIEFGAIPVGALLMAAAMILLSLLTPGLWMTAILMFVAGVGAGIYIIPIEAFIQYRAPADRRGETIAAAGFLGWVGVIASGVMILGLSYVPGWVPANTFLVLGLMTLALTVVTVILLPDFLVRFTVMAVVRFVYRMRTSGIERLPDEGGALLVANHASTMDAVQLLAMQQRRIRFLMDREIYETHALRRLFRLMGVIPISMQDPPKKILASLHEARKALEEGFMVCIFAEGALTRTGQLQDFRPGLERIVKGTAFPIVPIYIGGAWGSRFSHYFHGLPIPKPWRWRYPITVMVGTPLPPDTPAWRVRQAVMELSCDYFDLRKHPDRSLGRHLVVSCRRNWGGQAMTDTTGKELSFGRVLIAVMLLARRFGQRFAGQERVAVLLPPTCGGALVNLALAVAGKVSVNLNFSASKDAIASAVRQADLKAVVTSKKLLERFPGLPLPEDVLEVEALMASVTGGEKALALIKARLVPAWLVAPRLRGGADAPATILFSSGTTGDPKGVVLTHHNVLSNVESISQVFRPHPGLSLCATLPLFHSFGLTAGIFLPMLTGMAVHYHMTPLEPEKVIRVVRERRCSALFSTPTFLSQYLRKATPDDFESLVYVVAGAEKLPKTLAEAFEQKFGIRPCEGFGCTEMAPVVALSLPDVNVDGVYQAGTKAGSVGQPVPGVAARIVDPETRSPLACGESGLLEVRGPNLMVGYLNRPDLTAEAIRDGWYSTGDIATMDEAGYIFIADRLHRFSKIGGEMVPHLAAEDVLHEALAVSEKVLAITAIYEEHRGERLILLYTPEAGSPEELHRHLEASSLPNLWKPGRKHMFPIGEIPVTATGKMDLKALKEIAKEKVGGDSESKG